MVIDRLKTMILWAGACALSGLVVYWTSASPTASPTVSGTIAAVAAGAVPGPEPSLMHGAASAATPASTSQQLEDGNNLNIVAGDGSPVTIHINGRAAPDAFQEKADTPAGAEPASRPIDGRAEPMLRGGESPDPRRAPAPASSPDPLQDLADELLAPITEIVVPLMEREEYREEPYTLAGIPHVCYGHQIRQGETPRPMTPAECVQLLAEDIQWALETALAYVGDEHWFAIGVRRQGVIVALAYAMGYEGLMGFDRMRKFVRTGDYEKAVRELWDSNLPRKPENGGIGRKAVERLALRLR